MFVFDSIRVSTRSSTLVIVVRHSLLFPRPLSSRFARAFALALAIVNGVDEEQPRVFVVRDRKEFSGDGEEITSDRNARLPARLSRFLREDRNYTRDPSTIVSSRRIFLLASLFLPARVVRVFRNETRKHRGTHGHRRTLITFLLFRVLFDLRSIDSHRQEPRNLASVPSP